MFTSKKKKLKIAQEMKTLTSHFADQHSANLISNNKEHFY